ncbi:uncharacterized protein LOC111293228 [Durio zibethinus]|uniref:Uncharacterized protein LOC111293228 n=1 Tax=Durio zibethinus TaxID=66656 RepID=A0A6P5YNS7_DURZI|nr:uncharacterized protein LOC111293228 [Durio zibethinus]
MGCDGIEFKRSDLKEEKSGKNKPKKGLLETENEKRTFWTACPYCHYMYEYVKKYEECCLLCQNCRKGFHALAEVAPPKGFLVKGKGGEYYSGYGFFRLGHSWKSFLGDKKGGGREDTGKNHDVVDISDDSDDEKKEMDVKNEAVKVKPEDLNNSAGRGVKKVKSVPRNTKKMMGRGVKVKKVEKVSVVEMNVEFWNGVADSDCGIDGRIRLGSGSDQHDSDEEELEVFEGDDDIFVGLRDIC